MIYFVYFDVGGVVLLDFSGTTKWAELKQELRITSDRNIEFEELWKKFETERCVGGNIESLTPLLKEKFGSNLPDDYSLLIDGFVNRFEVNKSIWQVIEKVHQKCKVGLLTNMYTGMLNAIKEKGLLPNINWDVIIDSSIEGIQKPDKRIFELGEKKSGFKGQEILFVENSPRHVAAAKKFGWQTFLYDPMNPDNSSRQLSDFFHGLLVKS